MSDDASNAHDDSMSDLAHVPELTEREHEQSEKMAAIAAPVIHETIRKEGDIELTRSISALAWSGIAAGMSMGFSLVGERLKTVE